MNKSDLLKRDIRKIFFKYLIPGVFSSIAVSLYVFVDTMFVGIGIGRDGLTALNIAVPLFPLFTSIFLCIGIGGANIVSITKEQKDTANQNKIFTSAILFALILGIIISILGIKFVDEIGVFLGTTEEIKPLFKQYFTILVGFAWAFLGAGVLGCFIRNDGNPKLVMMSTIIANIVNMIFDYIFIFKFNLGMTGAVLATVMSPLVNICILLTHFKSKNNTLFIEKLKIDFHIIGKILLNGFGTFILEFCRGISIFLFNIVLITIGGNIYVAAYGIILNVSYVIICIFSGIAQSTQPIVSSNFGASRFSRCKKALKYGVSTSVIFAVISYIFIFIFSEEITSIFIQTVDYELTKITSHGIKIYLIACLFMAFNIVVIYFFQSINQSKKSMIISLLYNVVFVILGFILLVPKFNIVGVWLVLPFSEILGFFMCAFTLYKTKLNNKKGIIL